ncbi:hypothetical protein DYB26_006360 [Aphanomyces astaci]|uniref:Guanylate-binding protein N-terminal domain-containing protein n=4 Tax=Aphanomyces astaci TaxID=112090 RepID=A0A3R6Y1W0_APHAT|nr:hypothetical protein DYB26_006360 [Aphanomyces astaci]
MQVLVWVNDKNEQLSVDEEAVAAFESLAPSTKLRVVGVLNGDAAADASFEATKDHQAMLHTMSQALPTHPTPAASGKRPLLWMHVEASSNVVVLHGNNEHAGRLLLVLLSSVLLYSQDSELNFDKLQWISSLPSQLKIRGNQDEAGVAKDLGSHLPRFVWVSRNSKVKWLKDAATGASVSPVDYFNSLLALDTGFSEASMHANAFKTYFSSFFPHRDVVMLSRALDLNAGIELAWDTPVDSLRSAYVSAVEKLHSRFVAPDAGQDTLPVKLVHGTALTASQFPILLDTYVDAVNAHQQGVARASTAYAETFAALTSSEPGCSSRALLLAHLKALSHASLEVFAVTQQVPPAHATLLADQVANMHTLCEATYASQVESTTALSKATCDTVLQSLRPVAFSDATAELEHRSREDFSDGLHSILLGIKNSLQASLGEYKQRATPTAIDSDAGLGPAMYPSLVGYLRDEILQSVLEWGKQVLRLFEKHMRAAEAEKDELDNAYEIAVASDVSSGGLDAADHRKLYEAELAARTDQLATMKSTLSAELEDKRTELERLLLDLRSMQSKQDARVASVEAEIQRIKTKAGDVEAQAQAERLRREQLVQGAASEISNMESTFHAEQKSLYNEQRELLTKVVELERAVVAKKTAHLQTLFEMETNCTKAVEDVRSKHKKELTELKTQAKHDISMLKRAYESKKGVVQRELDNVNALVKQCEEQLRSLEPMLDLPRDSGEIDLVSACPLDETSCRNSLTQAYSSVLADLDSKAITNQSINKSLNLPSKRPVNPLNADQRKQFAAGECQARVARLVPLLLEHISLWNSSSKIILRRVAAARRVAPLEAPWSFRSAKPASPNLIPFTLVDMERKYSTPVVSKGVVATCPLPPVDRHVAARPVTVHAVPRVDDQHTFM